MSLKICITMLLGLTKFNQTIHVFKDNVLKISIYFAQKNTRYYLVYNLRPYHISPRWSRELKVAKNRDMCTIYQPPPLTARPARRWTARCARGACPRRAAARARAGATSSDWCGR